MRTLQMFLLSAMTCVLAAADTPTLHLIADAHEGNSFGSLEGPVWLPRENALLFSDQNNGREYRWTPAGGVEPVRDLGYKVNGHAVDDDGMVYICEAHKDDPALRRIVRRNRTGALTVVADGYDGHPFNGPNDIAVHPLDGSIWFTDPYWGNDQERLNRQFVYRIDPTDHSVAPVFADSFSKPNGLGFAPDGRTFYLNSNGTNEIFAFSLDEDGLPDTATPQVLADNLDKWPDGMAIHPDTGAIALCLFASDALGADGQGVNLLSTSGSSTGVIPVPGNTTNAAYTPDGSRLFVTSGSGLYYLDFASESPTATLREPTGSERPNGRLQVRVAFSEPVVGLESGDFQVQGASILALQGSGSRYLLWLQPTDTEVTIDLPAGAANAWAPDGRATAAADTLTLDTAATRTIHLTVTHDGVAFASAVTTERISNESSYFLFSLPAAAHSLSDLHAEDTHAITIDQQTPFNRAPVVTVDASAWPRLYAPEDTIAFSATAMDAEDGDLTDSLSWVIRTAEFPTDTGFVTALVQPGPSLAVAAADLGLGWHRLRVGLFDSEGAGHGQIIDVVVEDIPSHGPDSTEDGEDERVVLPQAGDTQTALVIAPYLTVEDTYSDNRGRTRQPRLNQIVTLPDDRLMVVNQRGRLWDITDSTTPHIYLDVATFTGFHASNGQQGFGYAAFHPDFLTNGRFYTVTSENPAQGPVDFPLLDDTDKAGRPVSVSHYEVLREWTADSPGAAVFSGDSRTLMRIAQPYGDHNVGEVTFRPGTVPGDADHGILYLAVADGGNTFPQIYNCPLDVAQDSRSPLGKILRIDPTADSTSAYRIPSDNPFVGQERVLPEIWAYGLRNPHRIRFTADGQHLLISDIGQDNVEELNLGVEGANYGWSVREGRFAHPDDPIQRVGGEADLVDWPKHLSYVAELPAFDPIPLHYPLAAYDHNSMSTAGSAIADAIVIGDNLPALSGTVLTADFASGELFAASLQAMLDTSDRTPLHAVPVVLEGSGETTLSEVVNGRPDERVDNRLGLGPDGTVYITNKRDGTVYRVTGTTIIPIAIQ